MDGNSMFYVAMANLANALACRKTYGPPLSEAEFCCHEQLCRWLEVGYRLWSAGLEKLLPKDEQP